MIVASGLLATVIGAAFAILLSSIIALPESARQARDAEHALTTANQVERLIIDLETGQRGFLITRDEQFLEPWRAALVAFPVQAERLERLVVHPELDQSARRITQAGNAYIRDYSIPVVEGVRRGEPWAASTETLAEGKRRVDAMRAEFDRFTATEHRLTTERETNISTALTRAIAAATIGLAGSVLLIVAFAGYLSRALLQPVRRAAVMADRLASGDLSTRMPENGVAEIGALKRSFNTMARSIEESQDELSRLASEQAALRRVATLVARGVPPPRVFAAVTVEVGRLLNADVTRLLRYEGDSDAIVLAAWSGSGLEITVETRLPLDGRDVAALVRDTRGPVRLADVPDASRPIAASPWRLGVRSAVGAPVVVEGRLWGAICAFSIREEPLIEGAESQVADFTDLVAAAIANAQAHADLAASRARVVTATDQTRRKIERDLHDGTQQRLVSLLLALRTATVGVPAQLPELRARLSAIADGLTGALDDLREITRGIHPAILSEGGLRPGLRALARRSAVPVDLDVAVEDRLPQPIEVAVYYVVAEALTNTAKHAHATGVRVEASVQDGWLHLLVRDDGVGDAEPGRGSGLIGLTDRVEALGGTITVTSPPGQGTTLTVDLPIGEAQTAAEGSA